MWQIITEELAKTVKLGDLLKWEDKYDGTCCIYIVLNEHISFDDDRTWDMMLLKDYDPGVAAIPPGNILQGYKESYLIESSKCGYTVSLNKLSRDNKK